MSVKDVLKFAKDEQVAVALRFNLVARHHLTFPIDELSESSFEDGFGFDGSSLRGWASIPVDIVGSRSVAILD
jgi:glutamine synthetase